MSHFDHAAASYDMEFTHTRIGRHQRNRVWDYLDTIPKGLRILEINCGTGEDAGYLATKGHTVLATDVSESMLTQAKAKNKNANITFQKLDLRGPILDVPKTSFDLVFSNFGGLNCLSAKELQNCLQSLDRVLAPGGQMILVIMPKASLVEKGYRKWKGQSKHYTQRFMKEGLSVQVNGKPVQTYFYSPEEIQEAVPNYAVKSCIPTGFLPSYFEQSIDKHAWLFSVVFKIEGVISRSRLFSRFADHFLIHLQKT